MTLDFEGEVFFLVALAMALAFAVLTARVPIGLWVLAATFGEEALLALVLVTFLGAILLVLVLDELLFLVDCWWWWLGFWNAESAGT